MLQTWLAGILVAGCGVFALWTLFPKALRSPLAKQLLALPHPSWLRPHLAAAAVSQGNCACDGCDRAPKAKAAQAEAPVGYRPMVFQPRAAARKPAV